VVRTRVGYAAGTTPDVNYKNIGDWMEAIQVDYDPSVVRYEDLLAIFFAEHDACEAPWKRQYASGVFFHDGEQERIAKAALAAFKGADGEKPVSEIGPAKFVAAEDYHQKYYLRQTRPLGDALHKLFGASESAFRESTAVARVNGYLAGHGKLADLERELPALGLGEREKNLLLELHAARRQE